MFSLRISCCLHACCLSPEKTKKRERGGGGVALNRDFIGKRKSAFAWVPSAGVFEYIARLTDTIAEESSKEIFMKPSRAHVEVHVFARQRTCFWFNLGIYRAKRPLRVPPHPFASLHVPPLLSAAFRFISYANDPRYNCPWTVYLPRLCLRVGGDQKICKTLNHFRGEGWV